MNQEKIGKLIKDIRTKDNLSQQKFASKYGVTYQAVSKWENGKNIPDIAILKQICNDYNIDLNDLLEVKKTSNKKTKYIGFIAIVAILLGVILIFILLNYDNHFEFKTLSTSCDNFNLYGSIAYNDNKSSIYISNITYCGGDDSKQYKYIECTLYETEGNAKIEISSYNYQESEAITLEEFLKNVNFNVDNYKNSCKEYQENSLHLEINAFDEDDRITTYKIPLKLKENCMN